MRMSRLVHAIVLPCLAAVLLHACAAGPRPDSLEPGGLVLDREDIADSRARTALEVIERAARHLNIQRTREGTPVRITHRGVDSLILDPQVLVVIDGNPVRDVANHLRDIPAASIDFVQILSGREAAPRFGSVAGNGAILVLTSARG